MSRIVNVPCRNVRGQYKAAANVNTHSASQERGDNTARALGFRVALTDDDAARLGVPFVEEHESGRGIMLYDCCDDVGNGVAIKTVSRTDFKAATNMVLTTPSVESIPVAGDAMLRSCPILVVHQTGTTLDLDNLWFAVVDGREALRACGGNLAAVKDTTGGGRVGRGGNPPVAGKWVQRKNKRTGKMYGHYWEVSVRIPAQNWRGGTIEEARAALKAIA
jgi:hypothetical protein